MAVLISIQVGKPKDLGTPGAVDKLDKPWRSAIFKSPVEGPVQLTDTGLVGDGQADRRFHGGYDKAVLAYSAEHYPLWHRELGRTDFIPGGFGENFTISGQSEADVCVGDVYEIGPPGGVRVEVSQPRQPCFNLCRRWRMEDLMQRVKTTGRGGWYLRVLKEGSVERAMEVALLERLYPQWPIARAFRVMERRKEDRESAAELASCPALSVDWKEALLNAG
jgi:MOSC domain-containing protein YiiM